MVRRGSCGCSTAIADNLLSAFIHYCSCALIAWRLTTDLLNMLVNASGVKTINVHSLPSVREMPTRSPIFLPRCSTITIREHLNEEILYVLSCICAPRIVNLSLPVRIVTEIFATEPLDSSNLRPAPTISRNDMRRCSSLCSTLGGVVKTWLSGPVKLHIHTESSAMEGCTVEFRVEDDLIRLQSGNGLGVRATLEPRLCSGMHEHEGFLPVTHILSAFAWSSVEELLVSYGSDDDHSTGNLIYPDPLSSVVDDRSHLRGDQELGRVALALASCCPSSLCNVSVCWVCFT